MSRIAGGIGAALLGAWALAAGCWLLAATQRPLPLAASRAVAAIALAISLAVGLRAAVRLWRGARDRPRAAGRLLLLLLGVAVVVRFAGLDFELAERYYGDEGIYTHHASRINSGQLLVENFIYPHLVFYLDAFVNWLAALWAGPLLAVAERTVGIGDWALMSRLLNRGVVALLGAATVAPVFAAARRLGGTLAAVLAGLALVASRLLNGGSHLATNDVPAAFCAAVALWYVVELIERERWQSYLLAGVWAGLAAAAKYPAGVVAVAVAAVWSRWRWRERRLRSGILVAGAAALVVFLATSPGIALLARQAFAGGASVFRGLEIYGGGGWAGVTPPSNALFYLGLLVADLGWPVAVAAVMGLGALARETRRALGLLALFPALYLVLVSSFTIAVPRTLYPILPAAAVVAAVPAAALVERLTARLGPRRRWLPAAGVLALAAWPLAEVALQSVAFTRPGTRGAAREWIRERVPRGAIVLKEEYTPDLPADEYAVRRPPGRFLGELAPAALERPEIDVLIVSRDSWARFFRAERSAGELEVAARRRYQRIFDAYPLLAAFAPGRLRLGPEIRVYGVAREAVEHKTRATYSLDYAFVPDPARIAAERRRILFREPGDWCQWKGFFAAGDYALELVGEVAPGGEITVRDFENRELWRGAATTTISGVPLPADGKYFFYVELPPGSELHALRFARLP